MTSGIFTDGVRNGRSSGVLGRYGDFLPLTAKTPIITLGEGSTPLVPSESICKDLSCNLYFKLEGCNPTGSFKDRGMVVAVAKILEVGHKRIICASTGNTSASAAAYGARYGLETFVLVPNGEVALGKLAQAMAYGARVLVVNGNFDQVLSIVKEVAETFDVSLVNSLNPHRIEGQKTASFEIVEELGEAPDFHCLPVGNAGNIVAYWKGYREAQDAGMCETKPRMVGFQAQGAAPIVNDAMVPNPQTLATAIRIGNPASWTSAIDARDSSKGLIDAVSDAEIVDAYLRLAREEGIFCEPASAASVAGLLRLPGLGVNLKNRTVVCTLTGNGLKDYNFAETYASVPTEEVDPDINSVARIIFNAE